MNNLVTSSPVSTVHVNYAQIVNEFLNSLKSTHKEVTVRKTLDEFYDLCMKNRSLIDKNDFSLNMGRITINQFILLQRIIENRIGSGEISKSCAKNQFTIINLFCDFISKKNIAKIYYKSPTYFQVEKKIKKEVDPLIFDFTEFIKRKNYASFNNYVKNVKLFLDFTGYQYGTDYSVYFNEDQITNYEESLILRRVKEELAPSSVYQYLRAIRLFTSFLKEIGVINFKYTIPKHLIQQSKRNNEYVTVQDILSVIEITSQTSRNPLRDLLIILIIVETGCRSLEVVNIELNNLILTERLITLRSIKSDQRTLKLSKELIDLLKAYLLIRDNYNPQKNEQALFLNNDGSKLSTKAIQGVFWRNNLKAFDAIRFSSKSLRHTFITNALNNGNGIESVANVVGHKHLISTLYYYFRDINSIKQQVLSKELNVLVGELDGN